jgi:WD40 repeat protein
MGNKQRIKTLEGHKAEISCFSLFSPGGTDMAIASASSDGYVRIMYDFMGNIPKEDAVQELYELDKNQVKKV